MLQVQGEGAAIGFVVRRHRDSVRKASICYTDNATVLEIEICIVARWRAAGDMVAKKRAKARARFYTRVPFFCELMIAPRHVAQIINAGQMRCRRDVGQRKIVAGEPAPLFRKIRNVVEMRVNICAASPNGLAIRFA